MERIINGVTCIKGEIHSVLTLIRLNTRWSQLGNNRSSNELVGLEKEREIPFVQSFRRLNEYLECIFDLREVDCVMYIQPFHEVIISDQANGPLTSAALSSLSKFALYGFLSSGFPRVKEGIALIANCISCCVFEETDWESDEVILMKLLELSALCLRCDASSLLTVGAAWDIYSTCIEIHNQYRASKILRSEAETALRHLTLTAFSRAHYAIKDQSLQTDRKNKETISINISDNFDNIRYEWDSMKQQVTFAGSMGITMLLSKIMTVLGSLMDLQKQSVNEVNFALSLINIALEAGGPALGSMGPLVDMLRGDICRHLLRATQSEDLAVFSLALRVVFNLFMSIKDHMKIQLEVFLTSVHLRLLTKNQAMSISPAKEELALESLLEFCREPALMQDLYTNYDCDVQCTNLFDSIITTLCNRAIPFGIRVIEIHATKGDINESLYNNNGYEHNNNGQDYGKINSLNRLALDGVFAVLHAVASRCNSYNHESTDSLPLTTENVANIQFPNPNPKSMPPHNEMKIQSPVPIRRLSETAMNLATPPPADELIELQVDRWCMTSDTGSQDSRGSPIPETSFDQNDMTSRSEEVIVTNNVRLDSRFSSSDNLEINKSSIKSIEDDDPDFVLLARARTAEVLRQRKLKKQRLKLAAEKFNEKPLKNEWLRFSLELGLILPASSMSEAILAKNNNSDPLPLVDCNSVAKFLKVTPGLGKTQIGEFLSKGPPDMYPFNSEVLKAYVDTFEFKDKNSHFDKALRLFLGHFRLPGEAQCIDRLMEAFANKLFSNLGPGRPFASADAAFILSFSTIMLNTDLHNPQIPHNKRMTKEEFLRNNRGINDGQDLPREYLEFLYDEIKTRQIQVDMSINDTENSSDLTADFTDMATWNKLLRKSAADQAPAAFTPTVAARKVGQSLYMSANEKDMFLVMANPYLRMLITIWENANDDNVMRRIIEGFWDYATICMGLHLHDLLSRMIQIVSIRIIDVLSNARKSHKNNSLSQSLSLMRLKLKHLEDDGITYNLVALMNEDFLTLISSKWTPDSKRSDSINWNGAHIIRGELMIKTLIHITKTYSICLSDDAWRSIFQLLLWVRGRGQLPKSLSALTDITGSDNNLQLIKLPLTVFGIDCQNKARGITEESESNNTQKGSWWSWLSSNDMKQQSNIESDDNGDDNFEFDGNCSTFKSRQDNSNSYNEDTYLELCMVACKIEDIVFREELDDFTINALVNALLRNLNELILSLLSSLKVNKFYQHEVNSSNHNDMKSMESTEINAVILLEWLCNLSFINKTKSDLIWPRIHEFLRSIFEDNVDNLQSISPYFVERCIVKILQAGSQIAVKDYSKSTIIEKGHGRNHPFLLETALTPSTQDKMSSTIWGSLRLMRAVPSEILFHVSDRIGLGVLSLLKNLSTANEIDTLEQWYMIFSLLSAATCGPSGRKFVWDATCLLIDNNLLNEINFTPCRHLLLRFLHGVFPGDEDSDPSIQEKPSPLTNPWVIESMMRLMVLTNMAMAGYVNSEVSTNRIQEKTKPPVSPLVKGEMTTFPLPSKSQQKLLTPKRSASDEASTHMTVLSIKFSRPHEVEMLWIESCKNFADLVNVPSSDIFVKAIHCIHAILISGGIVGLPKDCWYKVLQEMITRLPLNIQDQLSNRSLSDFEKVHRCLSSCNVIFEMLVGHIKDLRDITDFSLIWLRFSKILATNLNSVQRDNPLHDEMLEMIAALLRLLRPPIIPSQNNVINTVASPQQTSSLGLLSFISPLMGYEAPQPKITQQQVTSFLMSDGKGNETPKQEEACTPNRSLTGSSTDKHYSSTGNNDATLLVSSWKSLCSQSPSLPNSLRAKNPQLVMDLQRYVEVVDNMNNNSQNLTSTNNLNNNNNNNSNNKNNNNNMRKIDSRTQIV